MGRVKQVLQDSLLCLVEVLKILVWAVKLCWNILNAGEEPSTSSSSAPPTQRATEGLGRLSSFFWRITNGSESDDVIRKMGKLEDFMATGVEFGNYFIVYKLLLQTKSPLDPEHVEEALSLLQRKFGLLRVGVKKWLGTRYFTRLHDARVLFEVVDSDDWEATYEDMLESPYDPSGPQWRTKMFTMPFYNKQVVSSQQRVDRDFDSHSSDSVIESDVSLSPEGSVDGDNDDKDSGLAASSSSSDCSDDVDSVESIRSDGGDDEGFPYKTVLLFGFNHAITDGTTNVKLFKSFLSILNDVVDGTPVSETSTVELMPAAHDLLNPALYTLRFKDIWPLVEFLIEVLWPKERKYGMTFPPPTASVPKTKAIFMSLSEEETSMLISKCRQQGVTVHCALTAAGTIAMMELIQKKEPQHENFEIRSTHIVNLRKFCSEKDYYGCNFTFYRLGVNTPPDGREGFWKLALQLRGLLKDDCTILASDRIYHQMLLPQVFYWNTQRCTNPIADFATSNLGDCSRLFPGKGRNTEVSRFMRSISVTSMGAPYVHVVSTFRGRLMYNMDYVVSYTTEERANEYARLTLDVLKEKILGKRNGLMTCQEMCLVE